MEPLGTMVLLKQMNYAFQLESGRLKNDQEIRSKLQSFCDSFDTIEVGLFLMANFSH